MVSSWRDGSVVRSWRAGSVVRSWRVGSVVSSWRAAGSVTRSTGFSSEFGSGFGSLHPYGSSQLSVTLALGSNMHKMSINL